MRKPQKHNNITVQGFIVFSFALLLCSVIGIGLIINYEPKVEKQNVEIGKLQKELKKLDDVKTPHRAYLYNKDGQLTPTLSDDMNTIKKAFGLIYNFKNGDEYTKHRNELMAMYHDDDYFKNDFIKDVDNTGHSAVDTSGTTSVLAKETAYQIAPDKYKVVVEFSNQNGSRLNAVYNVDTDGHGKLTKISRIRGLVNEN